MKGVILKLVFSMVIMLTLVGCNKEESLELTTATVITATITNLTSSSAKSGGEIIEDGGAEVIARGVCWSTNPNPTIEDSITMDGAGIGSFESNLTDLEINKTYYVRAYATNSIGIAYGSEKSFTTSGPCGGLTTITDVDGNTYNLVQIGSQCWTKENLKTTKYNDNLIIENVTEDTLWNNLLSGAWSYYDNDSENNSTFGKLYNWYAVNTGKLCPTDWHIPTTEEWTTLTDFLGGTESAGGDMKTTTEWDAPNTGATNSSGFSAYPGGVRFLSGFLLMGANAFWWSSSDGDLLNAWYRSLASNGSNITKSTNGKSQGFSCRCIKD